MDPQENNTQNSTPAPSAQPELHTPPKTEDNTLVMGILSYLGPLVIISYLASKDNPVVKFHIKQGLVLFCIEIFMAVFSQMFWSFWMLLDIVHLFTLVLSILGILNVVNGKEKELPLVGSFAKHFTF